MDQDKECKIPGILDEEEPLLGSVTTYNNTEGSEIKSQQIRSSARVYKKLKLDCVPLVTEKKEKKEDVKQDNKGTSKLFRPLWTLEDKSMFFEALNEFGKDFENIQIYISAKQKKKGVPDHIIKNKDQVRHFYYRTWHKISKYLKFTEGVKKVVQELYGIINYGELRKRIGSASAKACMKLNDLIYSGSIVYRFKGKNIRIKTPMCRALRRLNQLDERYDEIILPNRVTVELRPKDMAAYLKVQSLAQNPRLRTVLPLQKRLSSIISCINKKWKTFDAVMYDKALVSSSAVTTDCVPPESVINENKKLISPSIRISPPTGSKIELPSINLSEYYTRQAICLAAYENRLGIRPEDCVNSNNKVKNSPKKAHRQRTDSVSDKSPLKTSEAETPEETDSNMIVNKVVDEAVNTILALQQPDLVIKEEIKKEKAEQEEVETTYLKNKIESIRTGWTEESCNTLTIGEAYLMFGSDSKLILEYSWDNDTPIKTEGEDEKTAKNVDMSDSLKKLLSVAKMHYRKNIIKCPCGHVCGTKNTTQLKRAMESKIRKMLTDIETDDQEGNQEEIETETFAHPPNYVPPKFHPITPATYYQQTPPMVHLITQLKPRYASRRGRTPRSKQVVVERKLPLLPNNVESGHQIVRMNMISQDTSQNIEPVEEKEKITETTNPIIYSTVELTDSETQINSTQNTIELNQFATNTENKPDEIKTSENVCPIDNGLNTAYSSPTRILGETDNQWINAEVQDYSLSSLLGHLESPLKSGLSNEDSRMSEDVDAQLRCLLTENSLDFSANFADLAAQVNEVKK